MESLQTIFSSAIKRYCRHEKSGIREIFSVPWFTPRSHPATRNIREHSPGFSPRRGRHPPAAACNETHDASAKLHGHAMAVHMRQDCPNQFALARRIAPLTRTRRIRLATHANSSTCAIDQPCPPDPSGPACIRAGALIAEGPAHWYRSCPHASRGPYELRTRATHRPGVVPTTGLRQPAS